LADTQPKSRISLNESPRIVGDQPTPFGPFLLLRRLGKGGMAEVFLAQRVAPTSDGQSDFARLLCVKVISPEHCNDPMFVNSFFDEVRLHARLHHDNIVQVYDFGEHEGRYYLALEYVEGCELGRLMKHLASRQVRMPYPLVVAIGHNLAEALQCAHSLRIDGVHQNLVHRDLSPHNVLLSAGGHAKLCDFGVAKARNRFVKTDTGLTKGKTGYMSPEQIETPSKLDGRTDLFALGIIMFELLSGRHPYRQSLEDSEYAVLSRILKGDRPCLSDLAPDAPKGLCDIVEGLLERDRDQRIASGSDLARRLEQQPWAATISAPRQIAEYVKLLEDGTPKHLSLPPLAATAAPKRSSLPPPSTEARAAARRSFEGTTHTAVRVSEPSSTGTSTLNTSLGAIASRAPSRFAAAPSRVVQVVVVAAAVVVAVALALWGSPRSEDAQAHVVLPSDTRERGVADVVQRAQPEKLPTVNEEPAPPRSSVLVGAADASMITTDAQTAMRLATSPSLPAKQEVTTTRPRERRASEEAPPVPAKKPPERQPLIERVEQRSEAPANGKAAASLRLVVLPFGFASVNGAVGQAPLSVSLAPGTYTVLFGPSPDKLKHRKVIRVRPGENKVLLELPAQE
jgi:eukaryotic-like serine/threonine-protein kinase